MLAAFNGFSPAFGGNTVWEDDYGAITGFSTPLGTVRREVTLGLQALRGRPWAIRNDLA
jgi:hypothetical protein